MGASESRRDGQDNCTWKDPFFISETYFVNFCCLVIAILSLDVQFQLVFAGCYVVVAASHM